MRAGYQTKKWSPALWLKTVHLQLKPEKFSNIVSALCNPLHEHTSVSVTLRWCYRNKSFFPWLWKSFTDIKPQTVVSSTDVSLIIIFSGENAFWAADRFIVAVPQAATRKYLAQWLRGGSSSLNKSVPQSWFTLLFTSGILHFYSLITYADWEF